MAVASSLPFIHSHHLYTTSSPHSKGRVRPRIIIPPSTSAGLGFTVPKTRSRHTTAAITTAKKLSGSPISGAPHSTQPHQRRPQHPLSTITNMSPPAPPSVPFSPTSQPTAIVHAFPSRLSGTTVYLVIDPVTEEAAIINPVLDLDPFTNEIRTRSADRLLKFISDEGLTVKWILETGLHTDRISACRYLQLQLQHIGDGVVPKVCVGENSFCTCEDESPVADDSASRTTSTTFASSIKSPDAFEKLFDDGEQFALGNIVAMANHLDDHEGVEYIVGSNTFGSSGVRLAGEGSAAGRGIVHHAEPPPEKKSNSPVSSRQNMTIDEVLASRNGDDGAPVKTSPLLAFYAEQINTRGGRIPKKINMPPSQRRGTLGEADAGMKGLDLNGASNGKGKERERVPSQQPNPLRIPRKLGIIMC